MWIKGEENNPDEESEDVIDFFGGDDNILIFGFYNQLKQHKNHFSSIQLRYRTLTSTWLLAAFAGIGFLLSGHSEIELPFNALFGVILLCFCAGFGTTLLWFLDIVLYQRLWSGTVVEMARLEEAHSWLPPINLNTLMIRKDKKYRFSQSYFYIGINGFFILISMLISLFYFRDDPIAACAIVVLAIALFTAIIYFMQKYSGENEVITTQSFR